MSNATDTIGCLSHRPNCRFFIMYEDFQDVALAASGKEHENKLAAFWRVLETKTNDRMSSIPEIAEDCKKKGIPIPEEHLWVEVTYSECVNRSRKIYKESAFQLAAAESERLGFSKSRVLKRPRNPDDPDSAREEYKEYLFHTAIMQSVINGGDLPTPIEINTPLLKSYNKRKEEKKAKRAIEKNSTPVLKSIDPPIEINNNKYTKVSSKDKEDTLEERENPPAHHDASASAPSPSASSSEQKLQQIIEDKTANGVGSPPAPSKEALNRTPETSSPRQKGTRKPKAEQVEKGTMSPARIESVFEYFDELGAEVTGDPSYCYERSKINKECIGNLLSVPKRVVTRESLRSVYLKLWTSPPDPVTGFSWQDNMSIKAVCRNYDRILLSIKGKDKAKSPSEQHKTISGKQRVEVPDDIFAAMMNASGGGGY